jgi:hypothetical protein
MSQQDHNGLLEFKTGVQHALYADRVANLIVNHYECAQRYLRELAQLNPLQVEGHYLTQDSLADVYDGTATYGEGNVRVLRMSHVAPGYHWVIEDGRSVGHIIPSDALENRQLRPKPPQIAMS